MTTVTVQDIKALKFCNRGARQFFEKNGLDWSEFVRNGIDAETIRALGDEMGLKAVAEAERREQGGQQQ